MWETVRLADSTTDGNFLLHAMVHKQDVTQYCNSQGSQHQEVHKIANIFSKISLLYTIKQITILEHQCFSSRDPKRTGSSSSQNSPTHTHRMGVSWDSLGTISMGWHIPAWGHAAVAPAMLSIRLWPAAQPRHGLSACMRFPPVSVLGVLGLVAQAINKSVHGDYRTAPFQQSQVVLSCHMLVQHILQQRIPSSSCFCCPVCHSTGCSVTQLLVRARL